MAAESALQFLRGLEQGRKIPPAILIAGPQPFLREYVLEALHSRLAAEGFGYRAFQIGAGGNFVEVINELSAADLFAPKRLVACRVLRSHRERSAEAEADEEEKPARRASFGDEAALLALLDNLGGPMYLALLYERDTAPAKVRRKFEQSGIAVNCMRPFDNQIAQYAESFARAAGLKLSREAADLLAARHGGDLGAIANSIGLAAIGGDARGRLEASDLGVHASARAPELFELSETMTRGRLAETIALFDRALETGRDPVELLAVELIPMLRRMMVAAAVLRKHRDTAEVARALGYAPASALVARAVEGARRFGGERLSQAHRRACELDAQFKMGLLKEREQAVASLLIELMAD
jgi:DNA polymerase III delta subunit